MNDGEILARHYATRHPVRLQWRAGVITDLRSTTKLVPDDLWLAPALFDLQINGFGGVDFQQDDLTLDELLSAVRKLRVAGCAHLLLTLITDDWTAMISRLRHVRALRSQSIELQSAIAGWHIEGPFLSAEPGFHGAHDPSRMTDPLPEHIRELRAVAGADAVLLTVSPEREGAMQAIELAVTCGMKVSLGHTNASAEILQRAIQAGATGFTHLGNGCPRDLDRHDNILWRVFEAAGLTVSLIPDRIHVSPPLFRLMHRVLDPNAIYYTSDAMAAAGAPPGRYKMGSKEVDVGPDQVVRPPGQPLFAGSALRPVEGVFRAAQMLNCPWQETWVRLSEIPARLMGLRNELAVQQPATFCVLKVEDQNQLAELQVFADGRS